MRLRLIRSATLRIEYAGHRLLVDPCVNARHTRPSYAGISPNPLVDLPCPPSEVFEGAELTLLSHLHSDHFDPAASDALRRDMQIVCQPWDVAALRAKGFADVTPIDTTLEWRGITMTRVEGRHGTGAVLDEMGRASGFLLRAQGEPSLYWAGDTILCEPVEALLAAERPEVVVLHAAGATWGKGTLILMDAAQAIRVCELAGPATVVATHLDSYDHGTVTRASLRAAATAAGIPATKLRIPADGEELLFPAPWRRPQG